MRGRSVSHWIGRLATIQARSGGTRKALHAAGLTTHALKQTALYDLHKELGGKMVDFAGYAMPVQYTDGIMKSHLHTREEGCASLFDVSHMGQLKITGTDRVAFLESVVVGDIQGMSPGMAKLSLITNQKGGIIDDCVISVYDDHLYVVINAGNKDIDMQHFKKHLDAFQGDVNIESLDKERSLVALQGKGAQATLSQFTSFNLQDLDFMNGVYTRVDGFDSILTRCGYTGEDGFEISVPSVHVEKFCRKLLKSPSVLEAGLGARDSLRLEAGLCLHGHDISGSTTPVEAALTWTIGKRRQVENPTFPGASIILDQMAQKSIQRKRVGFAMPKGSPPAREGVEIYDMEEKECVGVVTSGTISPCLKHPIGMAYVSRGHFKLQTPLKLKIRNKFHEMVVTKMPFVPAQYYKKSA